MAEKKEISIVDALWNDIDQCFGQPENRAPIPLMGVVGLMVMSDRLAPSHPSPSNPNNPSNREKMEYFFEGFFDSTDSDKTKKAQALYQLRCKLVHEYGFMGERKESGSTELFPLALTEMDAVTESMKIVTTGSQNEAVININWLYEKVKTVTSSHSDTGKFHVYAANGNGITSGSLTSTSPSLSGESSTDWNNIIS